MLIYLMLMYWYCIGGNIKNMEAITRPEWFAGQNPQNNLPVDVASAMTIFNIFQNIIFVDFRHTIDTFVFKNNLIAFIKLPFSPRI